MSQVRYGFSVEARGQTPGWFEQVHGNAVLDLTGRGPQPPLAPADAGFTRGAERIHVFTADCLPVLLHGSTPDAPVAAIHAGWRGALAGIVKETLALWDYPRAQTTAILGPAIGPCCFEVRADFVRAFADAGKPTAPFTQERGGKLFFDLASFVVETQLPGVFKVQRGENVCTFGSEPRLPSYRRNGNTDTRLRAWIHKN